MTTQTDHGRTSMMATLAMATIALSLPLTASAGPADNGLDLDFGHDQKYDDWLDDPSNPENPNYPEDPDPDGPEEPPEPPELYGEELPTELASIVYIIDISCSMDSQWQTFVDEYGNQVSGYRMDRAKAEVNSSIFMLSEDYKFDVMSYTCSHESCNGELKDATEANKAQAAGWVGGLSASGATGTGPAVAWALQNPGYEECMTYVLVTDGAPNCLDDGYGWADWQTHISIIDGANTKGATIHVIAISPDYVDMVMFGQQIAAMTGGQFTVVN